MGVLDWLRGTLDPVERVVRSGRGAVIRRGSVDGEPAIRAWLDRARSLADGALTWDTLSIEKDGAAWHVGLKLRGGEHGVRIREYAHRADRAEHDRDLLELCNGLIALRNDARQLYLVDRTREDAEHDDDGACALVFIGPDLALEWHAQGIFLEPNPNPAADDG